MKKPFNPELKPVRFRGQDLYEVDCRQWKIQMQTLGYPLRRRFPTKREAQEWCRRLVVDNSVGRRMDPGPVALQSLSALYLKSIEASGSSPRTIEAYRSMQKRFLGFLKVLEISDVRAVTATVIDMYRTELHAGGLQAGSIRVYLANVKALYSWANRMGYVQGNPAAAVVAPKGVSKRRAFTLEEQRKLLTEGKPELVPLWTLLFLTGLRRIEVVRLRRDDAVIDTPAPFLNVHGKGDKWRTVPLVPAAQRAVETFLAQDNGERLLPYSYRQVYERWREERTRLKLPGDLDVHSFRHTFLSWLANRTGTPLTAVVDIRTRPAGRNPLSRSSSHS